MLADGLQFPEGPVALGDGSVAVVEIRGGTVARVDGDGRVERIASTGGGPNGPPLGLDGRLYVANNGGLAWRPRGDGRVLPSRLPPRTAPQPPGRIGGRIQ